jgi:hypothetical protein
MRTRLFAIGVTLVLLLAASAATVAHHSPGHSGGPPWAQEPSDDAAVEVPEDDATGDDTVHEPQPEPDPLLTGYIFTEGNEENFEYLEDGFLEGLQQDAPHGTRTITDSGSYDGWDVLLTDQSWDVRYLATDDWITLELSRPATVAIVWQADEPIPAWLDEWTYVGDPVVIEDSQSPKPRQVYERNFDAGEVVLGGVYSEGESGDQRSPYVVVFTDHDPVTPPEDDNEAHDDAGHSDDGHGHDDDHSGTNPGEDEHINDVDEWLYGTHHWSVEPLSVVDTDALDQPVAGEECPGWLNFAHTTQAPDGMYYLTWRPIVDPNYGCHFTYEHGSNPERVPGAEMPAFGYGTPHHARESNYGFKVSALEAGNGVQVLVTTHFGTAEPHKAVCQRFHWNNFQFVQHGELVANVTVMGDFGAAIHNDTHEPLDPNNLHQCVNPRTGEIHSQAEILERSGGARLNPVCTGPSNGDCGTFYYPWRVSTPRGILGLETWAYTINTPGVVASCEDMDCLESRNINGKGVWRFITINHEPVTPLFGVIDPGHSTDGVYYTNVWGDELRNADDPDAVRQYVRPGTEIRLARPSDNHAFFPDNRYNPQPYGDVTFTQMALGDPNIADGHAAAVDPHNYIGPFN